MLFNLLFAALAVHAAPTFDVAEIDRAAATLKFLSGLEKLRIQMVSAPGNGHQASAVQVIKRLRHLGYAGRIELRHRLLDQRLEMLLPPYRISSSPSFLPELNLELVPDDLTPTQRLPLAIQVGEGETREMNTEHILRLAPAFYLGTTAIQKSGEWQRLSNIVNTMPLRVAKPEVPDFQIFSERQMRHADRFEKKIAGLNTLMRQRPNFDIWTGYGLGYDGTRSLATLLRAASRARQRRPDIFRRPTVMVLLSNLNASEFDRVREEAPAAIRLNIADPELEAKMMDLSVGEVVLLSVGSVSQETWNFLIDQSDLPPIVAGTTAINYLLQHQKRFFMSGGWLPGDEESRPLHRELFEIADAMRTGEVNRLADAVIESREPMARVDPWQKYGTFIGRQPDRLCAALLNTKDIIRSR